MALRSMSGVYSHTCLIVNRKVYQIIKIKSAKANSNIIEGHTDIYLNITQQGIRPDVVKLTIKNSITHHPGKSLRGGSKLRCVEGDLAVAHVGWELLETGQQVLVLAENRAEALLLRPLGHFTHKLEQAFAGGGDDKVFVLQAPLNL